MSETVKKLWVLRGFSDAKQGLDRPSHSPEGDLEAVEAWEKGHARFHQIVDAEMARLEAEVSHAG